MVDAAQFLGPLGGLVCLAWAMGAVSGYTFHGMTVLKLHQANAAIKELFMKEQIEEFRADVAKLEQEISTMRARMEK
jgi:hypothetical protein